jgi:prevent-host-death family protein
MSSSSKRTTSSRNTLPRRWPLQDAKARFSELVRRAQQEGPQHVTVHGRDSVVVVSEEDFRALSGARTGEHSGRLLVELLANSPLRDVEIEHAPVRGPVRDVDL